jgi:hypothetical protein
MRPTQLVIQWVIPPSRIIKTMIDFRVELTLDTPTCLHIIALCLIKQRGTLPLPSAILELHLAALCVCVCVCVCARARAYIYVYIHIIK